MEYRVQLDIYNGPMDLLLYLIKRDELDIYDIPISKITNSYMEYVSILQTMSTEGGLDINVAGEFLVMAATLMEIKSALLLPRLTENAADPNAPTTEDITDPRYELVQKLLEYKRFKDSATLLGEKALVHSQRFPRYPARAETAGSDEPPPLDMEEVQIWDLLEAFDRLMQEVGLRKTVHEVTYDDTPIDLHAADIEDRLKTEGKLTLRQLIFGKKTKGEMIGVFLAILELTREKKIVVTQNEAHDDLVIEAASEEHRRIHLEAMMQTPSDDEVKEGAAAATAAPAKADDQAVPEDDDDADEAEDEDDGDDDDEEDDEDEYDEDEDDEEDEYDEDEDDEDGDEDTDNEDEGEEADADEDEEADGEDETPKDDHPVSIVEEVTESHPDPADEK